MTELEKAQIDQKLEVVLIGVSDIDRAKAFYENLGWRFDGDFTSGSVSTRKVVFICDLTSFQGLSSPTMSFPITLPNAGSFPSCKGNIQ
jgi:catechol 2,3-dioxygenase-like lactoylglutathione lyase family enzyme